MPAADPGGEAFQNNLIDGEILCELARPEPSHREVSVFLYDGELPANLWTVSINRAQIITPNEGTGASVLEFKTVPFWSNCYIMVKALPERNLKPIQIFKLWGTAK